MKMKTLLTIATAALAAATFAAGPREGRGSGPRGPRGGMEGPNDPVVRMVTNPKVAEQIGLSEDQRKQIKEINRANRDKTEGLRKTLREANERQTELLKAGKIDEAAVMAEIDKSFEARKEMAKIQTRRIIAIKAILTPEQVEKALAELKNRPKRGPGHDAERRGPKGEGADRGPDRECPGDGPKGDKPDHPED